MFLGGCNCGNCGGGLGAVFEIPQPNMDCVPFTQRTKNGGQFTRYNCELKVTPTPPAPVATPTPKEPRASTPVIVQTAAPQVTRVKYDEYIPLVQSSTAEPEQRATPTYITEAKISAPSTLAPIQDEPAPVVTSAPEPSGTNWPMILALVGAVFLIAQSK